jgi:beta propeller repeat protein
MASRMRIALALSLLFGVVAFSSPAGATKAVSPSVINNVEQKVNGEGPRGEAPQQFPDVSSAGWAVWWDGRGTATTMAGSSVWAKDLTSRAESRVTVLATAQTFPRISGNWVVWEDVVSGNREVLARTLPPTGSIVNVTNNPDAQGFPAIDGTKVVWEDSRNAATTGIDIYLRDLAGGSEQLVTNAPGDQLGPEISGNTVVWTDAANPTEYRVMGHYLTDPPGNDFVIADPVGVDAFGPAVSGSRVVWTEGTQVRTCELSGTGCAAASVAVWSSSDVQSDADVSGSRVVWAEGGANPGDPAYLWYRDLSVPGANLPSMLDAPVGGVRQGGIEREHPAGVRIDGTKAAWSAFGLRGADVFWKDVTSVDQPARANALGLGPYPNQQFVTAGATAIAYLSDSGGFSPQNAVWATDLTGDRRVLRVSTFADFGTAIGPPKITGTKVVWSDARDGLGSTGAGFMQGPNLFSRDLAGGDEARLTAGGYGNAPDVDGTRTAWLCQQTFFCVMQNGLTTRIPLPVTGGWSADQQVRISGTAGLWDEYVFGDPEQPWLVTDSRLHAVDLTTGEDEVLGSGANRPTWPPSFDLSGANAAWVGLDGIGNWIIYRNTVAFPCGSSCDRSGLATELFTPGGINIGTVSMDGTRVAWTQSNPDFDRDVWLKDVTAPTSDPPSQVTTSGTATWDVTLFGDWVYWTDSRAVPTQCPGGGCGTDVYREYIGSGTPPAPLPADTAAPAGVTRLSATVAGSAIKVAWTLPTTPDLAGVIVVRKTVPAKGKGAAATSIDDPNGTIVYDGLGTGFTDTDVAPAAASYAYTAFTYDEVPNYSAGVATR